MYQRPGRKVWYCSFSDTEKHIGLGTEDEVEAREKFAQLLASRRDLELATGEKLLGEIVPILRARAEKANTDKTAYELHLNLRRVLKWLEGRNVFTSKGVNKTLIEAYKTERAATVTPARVNRELDSWKRLMGLAVELKCAPRDILDAFEHLREPHPEPHQVKRSREEVAAVLEAADFMFPDHHKFFRAVIGSAIRDDEARHASVDDVREEQVGHQTVHWLVVTPKPKGACSCCPKGWSTKGYRYRKIPITAETAEAVCEFVAARDAGRVKIHDPKDTWKVLQTCCEAAGVEAFSLHSLRHAWATQMFEAGHKIGLVSKWLGHRDVLTTMRYLGVTEDEAPAPESLPW